jgi:hypothetical protein
MNVICDVGGARGARGASKVGVKENSRLGTWMVALTEREPWLRSADSLSRRRQHQAVGKRCIRRYVTVLL